MNTWHPLRSRKCRMLNVDEINAQLKPSVALLKQEMQHLRAPASLEANLLDAFARQHPPNAWWRRWFAEPWQWSGVLVMGLLVGLLIVNKPLLTSIDAQLHATKSLPTMQAEDWHEEIPFVALESGETILKQDTMRIVRANVPHTMWASLGVPVNPQEAGESSIAEMLLGENDEYLAMRLIPGE